MIAHLVDDTNAAVTDLAGGPVKQAHTAVRLDQAIFGGHVARPDVFPAAEILAVEELLPGFFGLREAGNGEYRSCGEKQEKQIAHRPPFAGDILQDSSGRRRRNLECGSLAPAFTA